MEEIRAAVESGDPGAAAVEDDAPARGGPVQSDGRFSWHQHGPGGYDRAITGEHIAGAGGSSRARRRGARAIRGVSGANLERDELFFKSSFICRGRPCPRYPVYVARHDAGSSPGSCDRSGCAASRDARSGCRRRLAPGEYSPRRGAGTVRPL